MNTRQKTTDQSQRKESALSVTQPYMTESDL